jgi:ribose 5-phosphate isomerase B
VKVALGSDHGGYELKQQIKGWLTEAGHEPVDLGSDTPDAVDYPAYAVAVAKEVAGGQADLGILICGTGLGMAMAANKVRGIRAAVANDLFCAEHARAHNDANILTIGARVVDEPTALRIIDTFLNTEYQGGGRHERRIKQIMDIENDWGK